MIKLADVLSQDEINALLQGGVVSGSDEEASSPETNTGVGGDSEHVSYLSDEEKDALGEIGNICMGTSATTLFSIVSQKVSITTPVVSEVTLTDLIGRFQDPCVTITIAYKDGLDGVNLLIINERDVKIITDLMMGGDGTNISGELTELHLSAICEAMNQMIGSAATSMSEMVGAKVDIDPPNAMYDALSNLTEEKIGISKNETIIMSSFSMTVGDLIDSSLMQIMNVGMARKLINSFKKNMGVGDAPAKQAAPMPAPAPQVKAPSTPPVQPTYQAPPEPMYQAPPQPMYDSNYNPHYQQPPVYQNSNINPAGVNAQRVEFASFDVQGHNSRILNEIGLIKDIPLEITVELGQTMRQVNEILEFSVGTVIELDKLVGENLNVYANGNNIAKGEVVVVDDNYGIRITEIVLPEKRL